LKLHFYVFLAIIAFTQIGDFNHLFTCNLINVKTHFYGTYVCLKSFSRNSTFTQHTKKTHADENTYKCVVCLKFLSASSNLRTRQRTHTGERRYSCKVCLNTCSKHSSLVTHTRKHNKFVFLRLVSRVIFAKFYSRSHINMKYVSNRLVQITVRWHVREHTQSYKPYSCEVCLKSIEFLINMIIDYTYDVTHRWKKVLNGYPEALTIITTILKYVCTLSKHVHFVWIFTKKM